MNYKDSMLEQLKSSFKDTEALQYDNYSENLNNC